MFSGSLFVLVFVFPSSNQMTTPENLSSNSSCRSRTQTLLPSCLSVRSLFNILLASLDTDAPLLEVGFFIKFNLPSSSPTVDLTSTHRDLIHSNLIHSDTHCRASPSTTLIFFSFLLFPATWTLSRTRCNYPLFDLFFLAPARRHGWLTRGLVACPCSSPSMHPDVVRLLHFCCFSSLCFEQ